jgi:hypothetical protein
MDSELWFNDPQSTFTSKNFMIFMPNKNLDSISNLNAFVRFGVYSSLVLAMYHRKIEYLFLMVIPMLLSYLIYSTLDHFEESDYIRIQKEDKYTLPTLNNPTMNVMVGEYSNSDRKPAYPIGDETEDAYYIKKDIENKVNFNLFRDTGDIHNNKYNQRAFYTMPNTKVPNDLNEFKNFIFKDKPPVCKENRFNCGNYDDPRMHSSMETLLPAHAELNSNLL